MEVKGLNLVRRDTPPLLREVYEAALLKLLEGDTEGAIKVVHNAVRCLNNGGVELNKLVVSKSLRASYIHKGKAVAFTDMMTSKSPPIVPQPHLVVAWKQHQRLGTEAGPKAGDRVGFVIAQHVGSAMGDWRAAGLMAYRAEDPEYMMQHGVKIDVQYYRERVLRKAMEGLFGIILGAETGRRLFHPAQKGIQSFLMSLR